MRTPTVSLRFAFAVSAFMALLRESVVARGDATHPLLGVLAELPIVLALVDWLFRDARANRVALPYDSGWLCWIVGSGYVWRVYAGRRLRVYGALALIFLLPTLAAAVVGILLR